MTNTVLIKRSSIANAVPASGDLQSGELAINYTDGNLFFKDSSNLVTTIASNKFVSVTGNITGGNLSVTGNITSSGNIVGGGVRSTTSASAPTSPTPAVGDIWFDSTTGAMYRYTYDGTSYYWIDEYGATVSSGNVTSISTAITNGTSTVAIGVSNGNANVSIAGTSNVVVFTSTGMVLNGTLLNGGANGVGNIGSSTTYFNTVFAKATSAQYADLAENYIADSNYKPGTVVVFGGDQEVTVSNKHSDTRVAGVVSTTPAYLMNSELNKDNTVAVALQGRVPTWVVGNIRKGDRLVNSSTAGVATVYDSALYEPGSIFGKSLENYHSKEPGIIEVVIGKV